MKFPNLTMPQARILAGGGVFFLTVLILVIMIVWPELAKDDLFKMLAQAIVIQGLIGLVMAFMFTGKDERDTPTGQPDDPVNVNEVDQ